MERDKLEAVLKAHEAWTKSDGGTKANLSWANLRGADLSGANLSGADLSRANLSGADLSGAKGLLDAGGWLREHFESDDTGVVVYKAIGETTYAMPDYWTIEAGAVLEEVVNPCRTSDCACGVNFATREWIEQQYSDATIWKCHIEWIDLAGVVVPYNTDGKARCARLTLLEAELEKLVDRSTVHRISLLPTYPGEDAGDCILLSPLDEEATDAKD